MVGGRIVPGALAGCLRFLGVDVFPAGPSP